MTPKQRRFVIEYAVDGNGTAAAIRAGYAKAGAHVTACRLLKDPKVAKALQLSQQRLARRLEITRQDVVNGLLEGIEMAQKAGEAGNVIAGYKELGGLLGHYAPTRTAVAVTAFTAQLISKFEAMTDDELVNIVEGRKKLVN